MAEVELPNDAQILLTGFICEKMKEVPQTPEGVRQLEAMHVPMPEQLASWVAGPDWTRDPDWWLIEFYPETFTPQQQAAARKILGELNGISG